jgi:amino acid transporter
VNNPAVALPVGIVGAVSICGGLYISLCLVLCAMVPYADIRIDAPFPAAFLSRVDPLAPAGSLRSAFLRTSARFVSFGALTGEEEPN